MSTGAASLPGWASDVLAAPGTSHYLRIQADRLIDPAGKTVGTVGEGVVRFPVATADASISFYREADGAHFHERADVAYAMTSLDAHVYHGYLERIRPPDPAALIVDVGGGDGRNATPWLRWGFQRVVVVDAAGAALERLRGRIAARNPEWLSRVLLIEADARALPLRDGCADRVQSIEALAYLNDDYAAGLRECRRVMARDARLLVADRDYEAGLLTRLFYGGGIRGMLEQAGRRTIVDGNATGSVRSRCFTAGELAVLVEQSGLRIVSQAGISALSLILGHERAAGRLAPEDESHLPAMHALLRDLGRDGALRRSHVVVAARC
jgi:ubiquinone/menaquinone biosynthesis C-methylase UbiE